MIIDKALEILKEKGTPLTKDEIYEIGTKDGRFGILTGKTPDKTLGTQLLRAEKRGLVVRSEDRPAKWSLSGNPVPAPADKPKKAKKSPEPVVKAEPTVVTETITPTPVAEPTKTWEFDCEEDGGEKVEHTMVVPATMTEDEVTALHGKEFPNHTAVYWDAKKIV